MTWQAPTITVKWGHYFQPDPAEQKQIVELVKAALDAKSITKRMAVEKLAPIFGIENVEAALEEIEEEADAAAERELEATTAALDAEARTRRVGKGAAPGSAQPSGGGGRPSSGKVDAGARSRGQAPNPPR
jgi:hypothetical protein